MRASISKSLTYQHLSIRIVLSILTLVIPWVAPATFAQSRREQVEGVENFGRVSDRFFRGGAVTADGVKNLAEMGVRAVVDLRDEPNADEPAICDRNGIKYFNFPMTGHNTPDDKAVSEILSIIQNAKGPVYIHCSAGKHRAGTIAALYRTRVQGWSKEKVWAEQRSYGFGMPEEHPELYAYVYGSRAERGGMIARSAADDQDQDKSSSKEKRKKKEESGARSLPRARATAGLSSEASYITVAEAIKRAKAEGGSGEVLKVDLEWDPARSVATWDVTFSSGSEYEIEANTGKLLGTKPKAPNKLAVLSPLELERNKLLTFQEIIRKAEAGRGQTVTEMELKRIKGRSEAVYEVVLADGVTLYYDAATGDAINDI